MIIQEKIAQEVKHFLREKFGFEAANASVESTRKEFEGDYTLVVFPYVKALGQSPEQAGNTIGEHLRTVLPEVEAFNVIKGFLNISLSAAYWGNQMRDALTSSVWLKPASGKGQILVEYSSPNTNKPLHLGHLRNIFLGHSVALIKAFDGCDVVKTQIVNDRGVHICKSMLAWRKFGKGETPATVGMKGDKLVGKYYVEYDRHLREQVKGLTASGMDEEQAKQQAPLAQEVREMLVKWEAGDAETRQLWHTMNGWVYDGFAQTYDRMGVTFDRHYYESETYTKGKDIVLKALHANDKGFYQKDDGSVWVDLSADGLDPKLLIRGDGTTVYMTQDIGTAVQRCEDFPAMQQVIYTVGDEQDYHFKVLFKVLEKLGYTWASACRHLSYGMVDLPSGKMKSREGTVVDADDLMEEVVQAAKASSEEKGKLEGMDEAEQRELFETLGIGALKFFLLRVDPRKRMMFDPVESVSLQGDTGPFVQYTHARCCAVLKKGGGFSASAPASLDVRERTLLRTLLTFPEVASNAANNLDPSTIANYCLDLAKAYNQFYQELTILNASEVERDFRLGLTQLTVRCLKTGMGLLGIRVPEKM